MLTLAKLLLELQVSCNTTRYAEISRFQKSTFLLLATDEKAMLSSYSRLFVWILQGLITAGNKTRWRFKDHQRDK